MEKINLRPHHLEALLENVNPEVSEKVLNKLTDRTYGKEYRIAYQKLVSQITPNTVITIVQGIDDICKIGCPFLDACERGESDERVKKLSSPIVRLLSIEEPTAKMEDERVLKKYILQYGKSYLFGDLKKI